MEDEAAQFPLQQLVDSQNLYVFCKNRHSKYLFCNERVAEAAGLDSPAQIINKTDYDLIWNKYAEDYRRDDAAVLKHAPIVNRLELQTQVTKTATVLTSKCQLLDRHGTCIGVSGSCVDITGYRLERNVNVSAEFADKKPANEKRYYLGDVFDNTYLTQRELEVTKYLLLGYPAKKSALILGISYRTVERHIESVKRKLRCHSKGEISAIIIRFGLISVFSFL